MNPMLRYIFKQLIKNEATITSVTKEILKHQRILKMQSVLNILLAFEIFVNRKDIDILQKKVKELSETCPYEMSKEA